MSTSLYHFNPLALLKNNHWPETFGWRKIYNLIGHTVVLNDRTGTLGQPVNMSINPRCVLPAFTASNTTFEQCADIRAKQLMDLSISTNKPLGVMPFDESTRCTYLQHLKPKWLSGLTLWGTLDWSPGNALIFDSTRLHCASDFRQQGIVSKLGISIFTRL